MFFWFAINNALLMSLPTWPAPADLACPCRAHIGDCRRERLEERSEAVDDLGIASDDRGQGLGDRSCVAAADGCVHDLHPMGFCQTGQFDGSGGEAGAEVHQNGPWSQRIEQTAVGEDLDVVLILAQAQTDDATRGSHVGGSVVCGVRETVQSSEAAAARPDVEWVAGFGDSSGDGTALVTETDPTDRGLSRHHVVLSNAQSAAVWLIAQSRSALSSSRA
jgi:hypothetical protein